MSHTPYGHLYLPSTQDLGARECRRKLSSWREHASMPFIARNWRGSTIFLARESVMPTPIYTHHCNCLKIRLSKIFFTSMLTSNSLILYLERVMYSVNLKYIATISQVFSYAMKVFIIVTARNKNISTNYVEKGNNIADLWHDDRYFRVVYIGIRFCESLNSNHSQFSR